MGCVPVLHEEDNGTLEQAVTDPAPAWDTFQLGWRPEEGLVGMEPRSQDENGCSSFGLQGALQARRQLWQADPASLGIVQGLRGLFPPQFACVWGPDIQKGPRPLRLQCWEDKSGQAPQEPIKHRCKRTNGVNYPDSQGIKLLK